MIVANERVFYIEGLQSGQSYEIKEPIENSSESGVEMNLYQEFNKAFGDLDNRQETTKRIKQGELSRQDVYRMMREKNMIQDYTNFNTTPSQLEEQKKYLLTYMLLMKKPYCLFHWKLMESRRWKII